MMRIVPIVLILLTGCATTSTTQTNKPAPAQKKVVATVVPETPPKATLLPLNARVVGGRQEFRFVIIDFTNGRRPKLDERLSVYRVGQKVGEVKISGPFHQDTTVAADLIAGEAKYGDEVKVE